MSDSNRGERDQALGRQLGLLAGVVLSCVIVAILAFSQGRESERNGERAAYYQEIGERNKAAICIGRVGPLLAECAVEQERAARQAYQSERDLNAQRDMALWAFAVFGITAVTAGITLWALFYVRGTLLATREALEDTGKATKAMVRQNKLTEAAQRPWLNFQIHITREMAIDCGQLVLPFDLLIENFSKTPAVDVQAHWKFFATGAADVSGLMDGLIVTALTEDRFNKTIIYPGESGYSDENGGSEWAMPWPDAGIPSVGFLIFGLTYRAPSSNETWLVFEAFNTFYQASGHKWRVNRLRPYKRIT